MVKASSGDPEPGDSSPVNARLRHASWLLYSIRIREVARRAFDLTRLGNGSAERLCSALVLGAAFFFAALLIAHFARFERPHVIGIAAVALVSVMATSGVLVLWKSDADLETQVLQLQNQLARLREEAAEKRIAAAAEQAAREIEEAQRAAVRDAEEAQRITAEAARPRPTTKRCPYCQEQILILAVKCKHCGEILDEQLREERRVPPPQRWHPGVAAVLSFLIPGLGQMYKGQICIGFLWLFLVLIGYAFCLIPGFVIHILCIFSAASGSE